MPHAAWVVRTCAIALFLVGFFIPWWPMIFFAPLLAAFYGYWLLALMLAVCADLVFGAPIGFLHSLIFPCTILVLLIVILQSIAVRHLR